jgi:hypothetical protein
MVITVPVLRPGVATNIRQAWTCPDRQLPESLICGEWRVDPAPNVVVREVRFQSVGTNRQEPWVIVWVTVEVPDDGRVWPIQFHADNPKLWYASPSERDAARNEARLRTVAAVRNGPKSVDDVAKLHAALMADSEPDTGAVK